MNSGGRRGRSPGEDARLSGLYQHLTEQHAAGFSRDYDIAAGLDRYQAWLGDHVTEGHAGRKAGQPATAMARQASSGASSEVGAEPRPGEALAAGKLAGTRGEVPGIEGTWDADGAVTELYHLHYRSLVRLAAALVPDTATAEEIVQDSFVAVHAAWRRLAGTERALSYLRQAVVSRCRSAARHRIVVDKLAPRIAADIPGSAQPRSSLPERSAVVSAIRSLPARQREVLMLRFYADLSEAQAASAMGITKSAVRSHTARAMSTLRTELAKPGE